MTVFVSPPDLVMFGDLRLRPHRCSARPRTTATRAGRVQRQPVSRPIRMARVSTMLPLLSNDLNENVGSVGSEGRQVFTVRSEDGAARLCDCDNYRVDGRTS